MSARTTCPPRASPRGSSRWPAGRWREYGLAPDAALTLLNVSENATYAVDDPATGERTVLRVPPARLPRRPPRSSPSWPGSTPLREDAGVRTPRVLPDAGRPAAARACRRRAHRTRATWCTSSSCPGVEPDAERRAAARLVRAARRHHRTDARARAAPGSRPPGFTPLRLGLRRRLRRRGAVGALAGRHRRRRRGARGARPAGRDAAATGWRASAPSPERYGLVHADLRLANLLEHGDETLRHRLRRLRLGLVPLRLRRRGELLRARPAGPRADRRVGARLPLGARTCPPRTRPRSRPSS